MRLEVFAFRVPSKVVCFSALRLVRLPSVFRHHFRHCLINGETCRLVVGHDEKNVGGLLLLWHLKTSLLCAKKGNRLIRRNRNTNPPLHRGVNCQKKQFVCVEA